MLSKRSVSVYSSLPLLKVFVTLALLIIATHVENAVAQNIFWPSLTPKSNIANVPAGLAQSPVYHMNKAGPKPSLGSNDCLRLSSLSIPESELVIAGDDMKIVSEVLKSTSPNYGNFLFTVAPSEVMWWVRTIGSISIQSLGLAVHEANHAVDALLTACNGGAATYNLNGVTFRTEHTRGDTPNFSIISDTLPTALKSRFRYRQYVDGNGTRIGSDFSILLDEFVAHTGAANVELSIFRSNEYRWLISREIDAFDGNAGGMTDFMVYVLSYLKAIRAAYPDVYASLKQRPKTVALLQSTWTTAEGILVAIFDYTKLAENGGVLVVSDDVIATAYSQEFILELDLLGISHEPLSEWKKTYLRNMK